MEAQIITADKVMASQPDIGRSQKPKLYMVEALRIVLMLTIFCLHVIGRYPAEGKKALNMLFGSTSQNMNLAVEFFFIAGGFFLYKRLVNGTSPFDQIKKTWLRLAPGLLFTFFLCVCLCKMPLAHLPAMLSLTVGTGQTTPNVAIIPSGAWFLGAYFWTTCLLLGIFQLPKRYAFPVLGVLMYTLLSLHLNNTKKFFAIDPIFGIINAGMIRGIYSMGLGVFTGFLAQQIVLPQRLIAKLVGTAFEVWCLVTIYIFIFRPHHSHIGYWEIMATMAMLMLSISQSWGYLSQMLNKCARIQYISRYVFPSLMGHMVMMRLLDTHNKFNLEFSDALMLVIAGGITLGIIEYHLVEKFIVPKIAKYIKPADNRIDDQLVETTNSDNSARGRRTD